MNFLMVGHTHEAVDRYFSFINRCMRSNSKVITVEDFKSLIHNYLVDGIVMEVEELEFVADWKAWIRGCAHDLHDHTGKGSPHHWRFERDAGDSDGSVKMRTKQLVTDECWIPRLGIELIKSVPTEERPSAEEYLPLGRDEPVKYLKKLEKTLHLLEEYKSATPEQLEWWSEFIKLERTRATPSNFMNGSEQHLSFPVRAAGVDPIEGGARREGEIRSVDLSNEDRAYFGQPQHKEPYVGTRQSRKARNDHAANVESLSAPSFVMINTDNTKEPLAFGMVTEVSVPDKMFTVQYYSRKDMSGYDVGGVFTPMLDREKGKTKGKVFPFTDRLSFDVLLLWDILCCKSCNKSGGFRLTERGKYRIAQCLQDRGHLGNELHESAEEEAASSDGDFEHTED